MTSAGTRLRAGTRHLHGALALLLLLGALWGCRRSDSSAADAPAASAAKPPRKVQLVKVVRVELADALSVSGTLAAQERVVVSAKQAGRLASISVDLGTPVKRGQSIAQIETIDYRLRVAQAEAAVAQARALLGLAPEADDDRVDVERASSVAQARATLEEARKNLERSQALLEKKLIGRADFDAVQASFARAESATASAREEIYQRQALLRQRRSELQLARQALQDAALTSPLDGIVQVRHASAGELLSAGSPVATIVRIDPLRLRLDIPDQAAARLSRGQEVRVLLGAGQVRVGKIARLSPAIDEQSRTLSVEAEVPNPGDLRPGSFVRAEIATGTAPVLTVPTRAIVVFAGIEKVISVEHGRALERVIGSGRRIGDLSEVTRGLMEGDEIVLDPGNLQAGDPVEPSREQVQHRAEAG